MHCHKKNLIEEGMNENAEILTHTIDYLGGIPCIKFPAIIIF